MDYSGDTVTFYRWTVVLEREEKSPACKYSTHGVSQKCILLGAISSFNAFPVQIA